MKRRRIAKRYRYKYQDNYKKPRVTKKLVLATGVSVLAVSAAGASFWHFLKSSEPADARESFSGIAKEVESHNEEEPFVILDIVPGTASYGSIQDIALGRMAYLTGGQSSAAELLKEQFKNNPVTYAEYTARENLADALTPKDLDASLRNTYQEGYEGITDGLRASNGWVQIFDSHLAADGGADMTTAAHRGLIHATPQQWTGDAAADKLGYDYVLKNGNFSAAAPTSEGAVYEWAGAEGSYQPIFGGFSQEALQGYEIVGSPELITDWESYSPNTVVYKYENGVFTCAGLLGAHSGEDYNGGENQGDSGQNPDNLGTEGTDSNNPGSEEPDSNNPGSEEPDPETPDTSEDPNNPEDPTPETPDQGDSGSDQDDTDTVNPDSDDSETQNTTDVSSLPSNNRTQTADAPSSLGYTASLGWRKLVAETTGSAPSGDASASTETSDTPMPPAATEPPVVEGTSPATPAETPANPSEGASTDTPADGEPQTPGTDPADATQTPAAPPVQPPEYIPPAIQEGYYIVQFAYVSATEPRPLYQQVDLWATDPGAYGTYNMLEASSDTLPADAETAIELYATGTADGIDGIFVYAGAGKGDYKLTADAKGPLLAIENAPTYFRYVSTNDWLKRYVFCSLEGGDNASSSFSIQVKAIPADKVTSDDVMNADLIYLEEGLEVEKFITQQNDMSRDVAFSIVYRAVNDLTPVIVDYGIVTYDNKGGSEDGYQDTLYQNLARILLKKNLSSYYQDLETIENMVMNLSSADYPDKTDNNYNYVNRNIYVVNDTAPLVSADFPDSFDGDKASAGFLEVITAIKAENSTLSDGDRISETVSKAKAMQYIINYSVGLISDFRDIRILELQPTSNTSSDLRQRNNTEKDYTILYWQKDDASGSGQQILRSSKIIETTVDTKSVAEFVGEQSDINNVYQMIFIGLDGHRLNYDGNGTVYNDSDMDGIVYSSVGDIATDGGERYEGIDITSQKKRALIDFMRAGYPIVVEDDFFLDATAKDVEAYAINTAYVDSSTQMYDFLRIAVSAYDEYIYTISDVHSSAMFAAQINIRRPQLLYQEEDEDQIVPVQKVAEDIEGKYRGYVNYRVADDTGEEYSGSVDLRFYLDRNQDGRFAADEELYGDSVMVDNGQLILDFESPVKGIIPWKLEVSDTGNPYRRDALTGFFEIAYPNQTPVRILQIIGGAVSSTTDAQFNLRMAYEAADQTLLGHYLKGAESLTNSEFEIEALTPAQLEQQLARNAKYLQGFDVLVLGFGPAYSLDNAQEAVTQYIAEGRGVLVSCAASLEETGGMGLPVYLLGQREGKTYSKLGSEKGSVHYYRYSPLKEDMFGAMTYLSTERVNDGAIAHYPYEIGQSASLTQSVKGADYLLDLSDNGSENTMADVTAWYCLGDSYVSEAFGAYDVSRKDATNNYYLYSKGNVVYIGEDNYPYGYDNSTGMEPASSADGVTECRLFVNALMAAYNVGIKSPKVSVVAGLAQDSAQIESVCIPFDEQLKEVGDENAGLLDETTDVYFKITEPNFAYRKDVLISFYYQDDAGAPVDIGGETVLATPFTSQVWTVEQNQLVEIGTQLVTFVPGKVYKIKAPVISLRNETRTNADIYIVVQSRFRQLGQERTVIGSDSVTLNRAQLFLLE